jgi:hypothetical protein
MASSTITGTIQIGAKGPIIKAKMDKGLATRVLNNAKHGLTAQDARDIFSSPQLNDRSKVPGKATDAYANVSEGNVLKPLHAEGRDRRFKVKLNGKEIKFTSDYARKTFISEAGRFYATKGVATMNPLPAKQQA